MSAKEKMEARFERWLNPEGIVFNDKEAEITYKKSVSRFIDAVQLEKLPDRVPVYISGSFLVPNLYGISPYEAMHDYDKTIEIHIKFLLDYEPDYILSPLFLGSGKVLEILDYKQYKWPGHGVSKEVGYQYVEAKYMMEDEYNALIDDPSNFWLRILFPRIFGALEPLKDIAPFTDIWEIVNVTPYMVPFGIPPVQGALKKLLEAGSEAMVWIRKFAEFRTKANSMGFPAAVGGATKAPFDIIGDTLRGTREIMIDLYRRPELVIKAVERLTPIAIKQGVRGANGSGVPVVFIPLHKGADGFMSDEQFKKFYWPSLLALVYGLVEEGCIPYLFAEGSYNTRLKYLKELPKGTCLCHFDRTDMGEAKKVLKDIACIAGNIPAGLLLTKTSEEVKGYCKNLIDIAGKDGGFILAPGSALNEASPDSIRAIIECARDSGIY
ncbi:MAG TPA: uroporphyrinogen decarboxylase family protein [Syntrophorhabdaceae bacterium]|nr:uroporphyrinogen decarboxylase family protein [Syntrophorhabdaceae bacterium]